MIADVWNELAPRVTEWAQNALKGVVPAAVVGLFIYVFVNQNGDGGGGKS